MEAMLYGTDFFASWMKNEEALVTFCLTPSAGAGSLIWVAPDLPCIWSLCEESMAVGDLANGEGDGLGVMRGSPMARIPVEVAVVILHVSDHSAYASCHPHRPDRDVHVKPQEIANHMSKVANSHALWATALASPRR
jgi:hypothetical protein